MLHILVSMLVMAHAGIFDLDKILESRQVTVVGWTPTDANPVPELLANELPGGIALLTEDSYGYPLYQTEVFANVRYLVDAAMALNLSVDGADHPSSYEYRISNQSKVDNPELSLLVRMMYNMDQPKKTHAERNHHMVQIIKNYLDERQPVIFLVSNGHLEGVAKHLKEFGISFVARATNVDYESGEVSLDGKTIGRMRDTEQWRKLRELHHGKTHVESLSWEPEENFRKKLLGTCAYLLTARPPNPIHPFHPDELRP